MLDFQPVPAQPSDSTPLLSTLVQSGAALVAIISGLLIARLVALAGERSALERRVRELTERRDARREDYSDAHRERLDDDAQNFIDHVLDHYFSEEPPFEKIYASYDDTANNGEELRPYYDRFVAQVNEVIDRIKVTWDLLAEDRTGWREENERSLVLQQFSSNGSEKPIAERVLDLIEDYWDDRRQEHVRESPLGKLGFDSGSFNRELARLTADISSPAITVATHQISSARYLQLQANEAAAKVAMEDAERELAHAERALAAVSRPEGLILTVSLLGGIALAGVVLPLIQLTIGASVLSTAGRWLYTGLFVASLVAFFSYLAIEIRRLNEPPTHQ